MTPRDLADPVAATSGGNASDAGAADHPGEPGGTPADPRKTPRGAQIDDLRLALVHMLGAERRLRGRDHNRRGELTFGQVRALAALGREGEMTAGQLARSADLNPASVTAMLDHLEEADIVQRRRGTEDRRVCNVSLTPAGWELLQRRLSAWHAKWERKLDGVSDRDLKAATRVLGQLTELYEELDTKLASAEPKSGQ